jgi:hypothetical protein
MLETSLSGLQSHHQLHLSGGSPCIPPPSRARVPVKTSRPKRFRSPPVCIPEWDSGTHTATNRLNTTYLLSSSEPHISSHRDSPGRHALLASHTLPTSSSWSCSMSRDAAKSCRIISNRDDGSGSGSGRHALFASYTTSRWSRSMSSDAGTSSSSSTRARRGDLSCVVSKSGGTEFESSLSLRARDGC